MFASAPKTDSRRSSALNFLSMPATGSTWSRSGQLSDSKVEEYDFKVTPESDERCRIRTRGGGPRLRQVRQHGRRKDVYSR